jgi:predicted Zn-dependent protease
MPGGYIYVTRGILAHLNSEAQLAGVIGHEIGHVTHRHSAEQITRQQFAGLGLGIASALSPTLARYNSAAQQALGLMFLSFSRTHETEADELGVDYSTAGGWDSRQMPSTYAMLQRVGARSGSRLPAFLSTHPDPGDRLTRTSELSRAATTGKTGLTVAHAEYLERLEGLVYGNDPRQGYFEGDVFYHPQLRFLVTLPPGWAHENGRTAVTAAAPQQRAVMQITLVNGDGLSPSEFVSRLQQNGKITGARGNPGSIGDCPAWVGSVSVADNGQERVLAAAFIRRAPDQLFQFLGRSAAPGDEDFDRILACARSFRRLTDPDRLAPEPARVHLTRAPGGTTLASVIAASHSGIEPEDAAILNNRTLEDRLAPGELIKTVTPSRLH